MLLDAGIRREIEREYLVGDRAREVRLDFKGSVVTGQGFVDPPKCGKTNAPYQVSLNSIGIDSDRFLAIVQCFGHVLDLEPDTGAPEPPVHIVGLHGDCPIAIRHGFVNPQKLLQSEGAVRQRRGIGGLDR
ncbi:hypothetical protein ACVI1J_000758 [Bradyrhizobium diazoefficiens]